MPQNKQIVYKTALFSTVMMVSHLFVVICLDTSAKRPSWMKDECFDVCFRPFRTNVFMVTETIEEDVKGGKLYIYKITIPQSLNSYEG